MKQLKKIKLSAFVSAVFFTSLLSLLLAACSTSSKTTSRGPMKPNKGTFFDGGNKRIQANGIESYDFSEGKFTIEAWIKADSLFKGKFSQIFSSRNKNEWSGQGLYGLWRDNGVPYIYLGSGTGGNIGYKQGKIEDGNNASKDLRDGQWHHVAYVGTSDKIKIYVDEELVYTVNRKLHADFSEFLVLGGDIPSPNNTAFKGFIKEVRFWADAVTPNQKGLSGNEENLVGYWPLNPDDENPLEDKSPNKNNAEWVEY